MRRNTPRTARKARTCDRCGTTIPVGHAYLEQVASPHDNDLGNPGWWRLAECAYCAHLCDRGYLLAGHPGDMEAGYAAYVRGAL